MDTDWTATEQWHGDTGQEQGTEAEHVCRRRRVFKSVVGWTRGRWTDHKAAYQR